MIKEKVYVAFFYIDENQWRRTGDFSFLFNKGDFAEMLKQDKICYWSIIYVGFAIQNFKNDRL
jgi:hypothetical protein